MIAKVDGLSTPVIPPVAAPAAAPAVRPDHIPEKFWDAATGTTNVEAMAKSYAELEKARPAPVVPPAADPAALAAAEAAKAAGAAGAGVDFAALTAEYTTAGALSEARYAELAGKGIPKEVVDQFIAGQSAKAQVATFEQAAAVTEAHGLAGGEAAFGSMLSWASANLSPADIAAFDTAVVGNAASRSQAITALKARYTAANGSAPALVAGQGSSEGVGAFSSRAEVTTAMRDPRYRSDPAYRAVVEQRVGAMSVF